MKNMEKQLSSDELETRDLKVEFNMVPKKKWYKWRALIIQWLLFASVQFFVCFLLSTLINFCPSMDTVVSFQILFGVFLVYYRNQLFLSIAHYIVGTKAEKRVIEDLKKIEDKIKEMK